jgi:pyruvate dehydrogenase E2 component (dihydrolipoamide acetyltransferase)
MAELVMPKMGDGMEEGTILRWLKSEGDAVKEQELIAEIQTEKATIEIPATEAGTLVSILVQEGTTVPVGTPIATFSNGAGAPASKPAAKLAEKTVPAAEKAPDPEPAPSAGQKIELSKPPMELPEPGYSLKGESARVKASPLAKKIAAEYGIDLAGVQGTGPGGRIIEADVEAARRSGVGATISIPTATPAQVTVRGADKPLSPMRKIIAKRLLQSKQTVPHFYLSLDVDMRAAWKIRKDYNASVGDERKISFNDLIVRAAALALERFPQLAAQLNGDSLRMPEAIDIGVAVALEEGLVVPVVRTANAKSVSAIGAEVRSLADRARKGQLKQEEYTNGTFSISNLGMYDVTHFQAIINPPETAIIAVGSIRETPIVEGGQVVPGRQMYLTISADHRVVDGHVAAQFMQEVKRLLQSPLALMG